MLAQGTLPRRRCGRFPFDPGVVSTRWCALRAPRAGAARGVVLACAMLACAAASVARAQTVPTLPSAPAGGAGGPTRTVPTDTYFLVLGGYYQGNFNDALAGFQGCARGSIKAGPNLWIDSICYQTMIGECYYQLGQHDKALEAYNAAARLFVKFNDWLIPVRFPPAISPATNIAVRPVPWGQSQRNVRLGHFPDKSLISQGSLDITQVIRQGGGTVQAPVLFPLNAQEIVRCTCLAIRRRGELLGPASPHDGLTNELIAVLSRRPVQPNHWSETWIDVQLGLAFEAAGKDLQARPVLERAVVAQGEYDHPLTPTTLLALGRIALRAGEFNAATDLFAEAGYAAIPFADYGTLEEALRGGHSVHMQTNRAGLYPPLATAPEWARLSDLRYVQVSTLVMAGEALCYQGQPAAALKTLEAARVAMVRSWIQHAQLGARHQHALALAQYQSGQYPAGDAALKAALAFQKTGSLWLYHIGLTDRLYVANGLSPRVAMELFTTLLRDPTGKDWVGDPLESLSVLVHAHPSAYEHWFDVALQRTDRDYKQAATIADLGKRRRFLASLELGGRLHALRWLLEGPPEMLDEQAALDRQQLLTRFPQYARLAQQASDLRAQLAALQPAADDAAGQRDRLAKRGELARLGEAQEALLREMAVRREAAGIVFPPVRATEQLQAALPEKHAALVFHVTSRNVYGFLMTRENFAFWPIATPASLQQPIVSLLRDLGNFDANRQFKLSDLGATAWKRSGRELLDLLMKESKVELPYDFEELVIVPDGPLWYVPFEMLQTLDGNETRDLLSGLRVRAAPLMGLAAGDPRPRRQSGRVGVALGKLFPNDDADVSRAAYEEFALHVPGSELVAGTAAGAAADLVGLDGLVVLGDLAPVAKAGPFGLVPLPQERGGGGSTVADWARLPWGRPSFLVLPGFHTAAENAAVRGTPEAGQEVFLAVCGLMATGPRTLLVSRWRPAGQTSFDLVREFVQELPHVSAAESWQRAVQLARQTPLVPPAEPRVKLAEDELPPPAEHPFFWAAYLLIDTGTPPRTGTVDPPAEEAAPAAAPAPEGPNPPAAPVAPAAPAPPPAAPVPE